MTRPTNGRRPRTLLEQLIRERGQTLEEFTESVDTYAREHGEPGTLSLRHLQRLITGKRPDGLPINTVRPATARLLEHMLGTPVNRLLTDPFGSLSRDDDELRKRIIGARRIDHSLVAILRSQLDATRKLDRQLGAVIAQDEVVTKIHQVESLLSYSVMPHARQQLSALLSELGTLAGWQALDLGKKSEAWHHYQTARAAATASESPIYEAHAAAEQATVLLDIGATQSAVELAEFASKHAQHAAGRTLQAWLEALRGETLAALNLRDKSLKAFDIAEDLLHEAHDEQPVPYVALDAVHLARWRGHAIAQLKDPAALDLLSWAQSNLDRTFCRAESALWVDLAEAYITRRDEDAARSCLDSAIVLANSVDSNRQARRAREIKGRLDCRFAERL